MQIAGTGGIHQDQPGNITLMLDTHLIDLFFATECSLKAIVQCRHFDDVGIYFI